MRGRSSRSTQKDAADILEEAKNFEREICCGDKREERKVFGVEQVGAFETYLVLCLHYMVSSQETQWRSKAIEKFRRRVQSKLTVRPWLKCLEDEFKTWSHYLLCYG